MRPLDEQRAAALAKARGITVEAARELLAKTTTTSSTSTYTNGKGH